MPQDYLYWNAGDADSEDSLTHSSSNKQHYVDPWDLENYAYIREHLDSMELSSNPSLPMSNSSGELAEANSTSFLYVPANNHISPHADQKMYGGSRKKYEGERKISEISRRKFKDAPKYDERNYDSFVNDQGNYAAIDEIRMYDTERTTRSEYGVYGSRRPVDRRGVMANYDTEFGESLYNATPLQENAAFSVYDRNGRFRKVNFPLSTDTLKTQRDRSMSFSYGDNEPYSTRQEIYSRLDDMPRKMETPVPIYDDMRKSRRKPENFGLSNYGHLKIDYSYSWNNLNKFIKYN